MSGAQARILIADDNAANRLVVGRILSAAGHAVLAVANGDDALALIEARIFDLVFMDVMMPGTDGIHTTRRVRSLESAAGDSPVPIVALTSNAVEEYRVACLQAGMNDFLTKPVRREVLTAAVDRWLERRPLVLLVDTRDESRVFASHIIASDGRFRLRCAASHQRALEIAGQLRPAAVVIDLSDPGLDGTAVARGVREACGGGLPVIGLSADSSRASREPDVDTVLSVPFDASALIETLAASMR